MTIFPILTDQLVRINIDGTRYMTGVCGAISKTKLTPQLIAADYQIKGANTLLSKDYINSDFAEGANISDVVTALCDYQRGITEGEIDTTGTLDNALLGDHQESCEILNTLASSEGKQWWVNDDLELNFTARYYDHIGDYPEWAPYAISNIEGLLGFTDVLDDFSNFKVLEDSTDYANHTIIIGAERDGVTVKCMAISAQDHDDYICVTGYMAKAVYVHSDANISENIDSNVTDTGTNSYQVTDNFSAAPSVANGDCIFNKTLNAMSFITTISTFSTSTLAFSISPSIAGQGSGQRIWYMPRLNEATKSLLAARSGYAPQSITFDTYTSGLLPRQMMLIYDTLLNVTGYFMIQSVSVDDLGAGIFNFGIVAEKRPQVLASLISTKDFSMYFNDL